MDEDDRREGVRSFVEERGLDDRHVRPLSVLFGRELQDPPGQIAEYVGLEGLDASLLDELVELYRSVRPMNLIGERYSMQRCINSGGMGEIWEVFDERFGTQAAMKVLRSDQANHGALRSSLRLEIAILAELQHPNVLPVHDCGELGDGRPWFTMPLVEGHDFRRAVELAHTSIEPATPRWEPGAEGWPAIQRLLRGFLGVCDAVAVAHRRGIVHRDLSDRNIFVGPYGHYYVLDWGIARWAGMPSTAASVLVDGPEPYEQRTFGFVGNPVYGSPEQALQKDADVDERSDVYSLGALLYLLLSNRPPYDGLSLEDIVQQVQDGPPKRPAGLQWSPATLGTLGSGGSPRTKRAEPPPGLVEICDKAMSRDRGERYETATKLADALRGWLDGATSRHRALQLVKSADLNRSRIDGARTLASEFRLSSEEALAEVPSWAPDEQRREGWEHEDQARRWERRVVEMELEARRELDAALRLVPSLESAHAALARWYHERHQAAEANRDRDAVFRAEQGAVLHLEQLPAADVTRREIERYLEGEGHITLHAEPLGASVELWRYEERERRLVLERAEEEELPLPLEQHPIAMGSYRLTIRHPERAEVHYPVYVARQQHWEALEPVWLPRADDLASDEVYVPPGWFYLGGDEAEAYDNHPLTCLWLDGFVIQRTPVTNGQYVAFLDACPPEARDLYVPRLRPRSDGEPGEAMFDREGDRYVLARRGTPIEPDLPVTNVDWSCAMAFLEWKGSRDGKSWRLPGDLEWEKAARGVDGRIFPWGDHLESSRCCLFDSQAGRKNPVPVDDERFWDTDASPFGVRGLAGNVRDWCFDAGGTFDVASRRGHPPVRVSEGERAIVRGGAWRFGGHPARAPSRSREDLLERHDYLGFRGVYPLAPSE